jgi:putative ABC transport system permease protein
MLEPRWRKVLRDVWLHQSRTALVVLAIAVGISGAGTILNTWALIGRVTREGYRASQPASATLHTDSIDDALLERVRAMPGVRDAQARRTVMGRVQVAGGGALPAMLFAVDDFTAIRIGKLKPEVGAWPPADGTLIIERSSLDFSNAAVGEPVTVSVADGEPTQLLVAGIARDVGLAPGWMEHLVYGFVTRGTLAQLGVPSSLNELQILVDRSSPRAAVRRIAYDVKAMVERTGRRVVDVDVPEPGRHIHAAQMDSLLYTQGAFGMLALLLSGFLVVNLITAMLAGQVREIGVMKAIGARQGQIAAMYLGLALVLGLVASALALPVAMVVGRRYAELKAELLNFDIAGFGVPLWAVLLQFAVGALLPVAAAAVPVVRGCRISVVEALRDIGIGDRGGPGGPLFSRASGVARPLLLSLRNAFRRRQRMALTLLTLATAGAVYLGALNLRASVRGAIDLLYAPMRFDLTLRFAEPHRADSLESALRAISGVEGAEAWSGARAVVPHADGTLGNAFAITAPPVPSSLLVYQPISGRWLRAGDSTALVVSQSLLKGEPGMRLNGEVTLLIDGRPSHWTVVGIVESGPGTGAYAPRETIAGLAQHGRAGAAVIATTLKGPASQVELIQRLRSEMQARGFEVLSSQLMAESRRVMEDHLLMVADFLGVMAWVMIAVGGLGLASTMSLAVLERTREIGVMRAIGARHGAIHLIIQVEGLVIALGSWLLAVPLSVPMSRILGDAFGRIMLPVAVTYLPDGRGVTMWLAVVVSVSVLACLWPAMRATSVTTASALAYE